MSVPNSVILKELMKFIDEAEFFTLYPTRAPLKRYLKVAVSDGDKIRAILRDEYIQRELFTDWQRLRDEHIDPLGHYLKNRRVT
jgi:hypothetical protein